ncbi:hypothetical protein AC1031_004185 [Aphanomyces cochlioides]|nr:hypothetical protein AC1031_004185 [Aphanomyces cochlioides]
MTVFLPFRDVVTWNLNKWLAQIQDVYAATAPWFARFGTTPLVYSIYTGDEFLLDTIVELSPTSSMQVDLLIGIATASTHQFGVIPCLGRLALRPDLNVRYFFFGIGEATCRGHLSVAEFFANQLVWIHPQTWTDWFMTIQRTDLEMSSRLATLRYALENQRWDMLIMLTKDEVNPTAKYSDDLLHAIKCGLMEVVRWLLSHAGVNALHRHVMQATKAFQPDTSEACSMLEYLLTLWLPTLDEKTAEKAVLIDTCVAEAIKRQQVGLYKSSGGLQPRHLHWIDLAFQAQSANSKSQDS